MTNDPTTPTPTGPMTHESVTDEMIQAGADLVERYFGPLVRHRDIAEDVAAAILAAAPSPAAEPTMPEPDGLADRIATHINHDVSSHAIINKRLAAHDAALAELEEQVRESDLSSANLLVKHDAQLTTHLWWFQRMKEGLVPTQAIVYASEDPTDEDVYGSTPPAVPAVEPTTPEPDGLAERVDYLWKVGQEDGYAIGHAWVAIEEMQKSIDAHDAALEELDKRLGVEKEASFGAWDHLSDQVIAHDQELKELRDGLDAWAGRIQRLEGAAPPAEPDAAEDDERWTPKETAREWSERVDRSLALDGLTPAPPPLTVSDAMVRGLRIGCEVHGHPVPDENTARALLLGALAAHENDSRVPAGDDQDDTPDAGGA